MDLQVQIEIDHLEAALSEYSNLTGKTPEEVMSKKGRDLYLTLYERFKTVRTPSDYVAHRAAILSKAKTLGWALGPISPRAKELAATLMGGQKSVVGRVVADGDRLLIRTVRIGKRGKRITGGRKGKGGRAATLAEYKDPEFAKVDGESVLNRRAVTVAFETLLRMSGSGSLATAWLHRRWKKGARGSFTLENVNPKAEVKLQGSAQFRGGKSAGVTLISRMPGTEKYPATTAAAVRDVHNDTVEYLNERLIFNSRKARLS